jgi:hypothetical protein
MTKDYSDATKFVDKIKIDGLFRKNNLFEQPFL